MTEQTELKTAGDQRSEDGEAALQRRRRLLKMGVSAAPLVLTLSSRSALACHCKSPSAAGSVTNASHRPGEAGGIDISANVKKYEEWMNQGGNLPGNVTKETKLKDISLFVTVFAGDNTKIKNATGFRRDIVTAYINLSNSPTAQRSCLKLSQLAAMASGSYSDPASGVSYNSTDIQNYLTTWGLLGYGY